MKWRDFQLLIPGWSIIYFHRECKAKEREWEESEAQFRASHQTLKRDIRLCKYFAHQMDLAR